MKSAKCYLALMIVGLVAAVQLAECANFAAKFCKKLPGPAATLEDIQEAYEIMKLDHEFFNTKREEINSMYSEWQKEDHLKDSARIISKHTLNVCSILLQDPKMSWVREIAGEQCSAGNPPMSTEKLYSTFVKVGEKFQRFFEYDINVKPSINDFFFSENYKVGDPGFNKYHTDKLCSLFHDYLQA